MANKMADEAAELGRRRADLVVIGARRNLSGVCWGRKERNFLFEANVLGCEFFLFEKIGSCCNFPENRLTRLFSSTIRTVIGSQYVRKKLSIALLC